MSRTSKRPLAWIFGLCVLLPGAVAAADLVVIVDSVTIDRKELRRELRAAGFRSPRLQWESKRIEVRQARPRRRTTAETSIAAVRRVEQLDGVVAAGIVVDTAPGHRTYFDGRIHARFAVPEQEARRLVATHRLTLEGQAPFGDGWLLDARMTAGQAALIAGRLSADPRVLHAQPTTRWTRDPRQRQAMTRAANTQPVYHRVPRRPTLLGVLLREGADLSSYRGVIGGGRIQPESTASVQVVAFGSPAAMDAAVTQLQTTDGVILAGPVISRRPLAFLTRQLVVRFRQSIDIRQAIERITDENLIQVRELTFSDNTVLLDFEKPTVRLYDIAAALLDGPNPLAHSAIPNLVTANRPNSGCDILATHHDYLREMRACDLWSPWRSFWFSRPTVAVIDKFATTPGTTACAEFNLRASLNAQTMEACVTEDDPESPEDPDPCRCWASLRDDGNHGPRMALAAAATTENSDFDGIVGAAPASRLLLIDHSRNDSDYLTDVGFAELLWWAAGADPEWCRDGTNYDCSECSASSGCTTGCSESCTEDDLPAQLDSTLNADIINLSLSRENFEESPCASDPTHLCRVICVETYELDTYDGCGIIDGALDQIWTGGSSADGVREGGAIVVNAIGSHWDDLDSEDVKLCYDASDTEIAHGGSEQLIDLAISPHTIAVGSVSMPGGSPFYGTSDNQCVIQFLGNATHPGPDPLPSYVDVMAPMQGVDLDTSGTVPATESSGAAAVVSGVLALMLEANHDLTADMAACILRATADDRGSSGETWDGVSSSTYPADCSFSLNSDGQQYSDCFGYGMVDAYEAIRAARACRTCSYPTIKLSGTPTGEVVEGPCMEFVKFPQGDCPCNDDAAPFPEMEIAMLIDELCMNCVRSGEVMLPDLTMAPAECDDLDFCECPGLATRVDPNSTVVNRPCYQVGIVNMVGALLEDVSVEICDVQGCQSFPARWDAWEPGSLITFPVQAVVYDQGDMRPTVLPEVRVYSGRQLAPWSEWPRYGSSPPYRAALEYPDEVCVNCSSQEALPRRAGSPVVGRPLLPERPRAISSCLEHGLCECPESEPLVFPSRKWCITAGVVNTGTAPLSDVSVELCTSPQDCRSYPSVWSHWYRGEVITVEFEVRSLSVAPPALPEIKIFSEGELIQWTEWPSYEIPVPGD